MEQAELKRRIDVAAGRVPADLVIRNVRVVDVLGGTVLEPTDVALCGRWIAGLGAYRGTQEIDAHGAYLVPGFIDGHIHVESSYVTPDELGRLVVPRGTTTIVADPHEIVNVCGVEGLAFMVEAAKNTRLDVKYMVPSCVPATPFEHAGAVVGADDMVGPMAWDSVGGLGEFMDFPGVIAGRDDALAKILVAQRAGKPVDGHSPGVAGRDLDAYIAAGIHTDHECATPQDLQARVSRGMYVLLREGTACHDLRNLLKGVTPANSRRCVLCSDDLMAGTILERGHLDHHLRICVEEGVDPVIAVQMATLNAAECFGFSGKGAIAPGWQADLVLVDDLKDFRVRRVFIAGEEVARDGAYLPADPPRTPGLRSRFHLKDFSAARFRLPLKTGRVRVIDILPGGVVTGQGVAQVTVEDGCFVPSPTQDVVKVAVVERHHGTGNVAVGLLRGFGIRHGAMAVSIAHDSHNILVVGTSDADMETAVHTLVAQGGGVALVKDGQAVAALPLVIGGLMSDQPARAVAGNLEKLQERAFGELGVSRALEPVMVLSFMALAVIPELKLTDQGLFDVTKFAFVPVELEGPSQA